MLSVKIHKCVDQPSVNVTTRDWLTAVDTDSLVSEPVFELFDSFDVGSTQQNTLASAVPKTRSWPEKHVEENVYAGDLDVYPKPLIEGETLQDESLADLNRAVVKFAADESFQIVKAEGLTHHTVVIDGVTYHTLYENTGVINGYEYTAISFAWRYGRWETGYQTSLTIVNGEPSSWASGALFHLGVGVAIKNVYFNAPMSKDTFITQFLSMEPLKIGITQTMNMTEGNRQNRIFKRLRPGGDLSPAETLMTPFELAKMGVSMKKILVSLTREKTLKNITSIMMKQRNLSNMTSVLKNGIGDMSKVIKGLTRGQFVTRKRIAQLQTQMYSGIKLSRKQKYELYSLQRKYKALGAQILKKSRARTIARGYLTYLFGYKNYEADFKTLSSVSESSGKIMSTDPSGYRNYSSTQDAIADSTYHWSCTSSWMRTTLRVKVPKSARIKPRLAETLFDVLPYSWVFDAVLRGGVGNVFRSLDNAYYALGFDIVYTCNSSRHEYQFEPVCVTHQVVGSASFRYYQRWLEKGYGQHVPSLEGFGSIPFIPLVAIAVSGGRNPISS